MNGHFHITTNYPSLKENTFLSIVSISDCKHRLETYVLSLPNEKLKPLSFVPKLKEIGYKLLNLLAKAFRKAFFSNFYY